MSENQLINNYIYNNKINIDKIIDEYSGYIYTIIASVASNNLIQADYEEIISDVFLVIWRKQSKLDQTLPIKPYIAGITRNLVKEKFRHRNVTYDIADYENTIEASNQIDVLLENEGQSTLLKQAIEELNKDESDIVTLYYYDYKQIKEIAQQLKISEAKVKTTLHRARKKLKKILKKRGYQDDRQK